MRRRSPSLSRPRTPPTPRPRQHRRPHHREAQDRRQERDVDHLRFHRHRRDPPRLRRAPAPRGRAHGRGGLRGEPRAHRRPRGGIAVVALIAVSVLFVMGTSWIGPFAPPTSRHPSCSRPRTAASRRSRPTTRRRRPRRSRRSPRAPPRSARPSTSTPGRSSPRSPPSSPTRPPTPRRQDRGEYNLCGADGSLDATQTKDLELSGGTTVPVAVAGIRCDERSDGSASRASRW